MQYEDFDDDQDFEPTGSDLVKQLRRQVREAQRELSSLREENEKLQVSTRQRTLAEALPKGVKKAAVKFAIKDGVTDEAGLMAWLEDPDNAEAFGTPVVEDTADEEAVSEEDLRQMQAIQRQTATGTVQTASRQQAALKYLNDAQTPEEWLARTEEINSGQFAG